MQSGALVSLVVVDDHNSQTKEEGRQISHGVRHLGYRPQDKADTRNLVTLPPCLKRGVQGFLFRGRTCNSMIWIYVAQRDICGKLLLLLLPIGGALA